MSIGKHIIISGLIGLAHVVGWSQSESTPPFTIDQFLSIVIEHHPTAIQAAITKEKGQAYILKARGGFDPKLYGSAYQKYFDGGQYYSLIGGGLKVPTWFGIELDAGYDIAQGDQLNPQAYTPKDGLWRVGVSVPLGKNLVIDERRAALKQAKIYRESTLAQQQIMLNQLLYDAAQAYWEWLKSYHKMKVYENAVQVAKVRFDGVKESARLGDKPFIDTLESNINLQSRQFSLMEYKLQYENAKAGVDVFLWKDGYIPLEISDAIKPPLMDDIAVANVDIPILAMVDSIQNYHPELLKYQFAVDMAEVDLRLSAEQLKPTVNLKYNALNAPVNGNPWQDYNLNNYQWGAEVNFPIFIRKERGDLRLNRLEVENLKADLANKEAQQTYKIWASYNAWQTSIQQIDLSQQMVNQYQVLLAGEQTLFNIGESSVFLINSREKSLIESQLKYIEASIANQKSKLATEYALGILPQ
ncbi:MAG: TolC family protein [Putridiphycobacter sp.]|nr:TolC family protein [Putridiphycobacter sp.]